MPQSNFGSIAAVAEYLDEEFDKVGRRPDGAISDAVVDGNRYGFMWAVERVKAKHPTLDTPKAQELVKKAGWY